MKTASMARAGLIAVTIVMVLAAPARGQARTTLTASTPVFFSILPRGSETWVPLNTTPQMSVSVPNQYVGDCDVRALSPGLFWRYEGGFHDQVIAYQDRFVPVERRFRLDSILVLLIGLGAIVAGLVLRLRMAVLRRRAAAEVARHIEELGSAGWFPADGSLPTQIGPYVVLARLGAGGMAMVYQVAAPSGDLLALKLPFPHVLGDADFRKRFIREARLGTRLRHPRLVRLDAVEGGEAHPYLLMEWVDGDSLDVLRDRPHSVAEVIQIGMDVLEGLGYIHKNGIVHRDLKPGNVIRARDGNLKIMDFGIARDASGTQLTASDEILGTPTYMAPEQLRPGAVDGRADLYALGVMMYEMLAGGLPYPDDLMGIITMKLTETLPPLSTVRQDLPPGLEVFIMRLVEADADHRFATAAEAREQLSSLQH